MISTENVNRHVLFIEGDRSQAFERSVVTLD